MIIHDISMTVTPGMVTWENSEAALSLAWASQIGADSVCNVSTLSGGSHTGTHLDAPLHFVEGGGEVSALDIHTLVGPAHVTEIFGSSQITEDDFKAAAIPAGTERLLLKTDNTRRGLLHNPQFHRDYVGIAPSGARWLTAQGVRLVGVDYLSVGPYGDDNAITHQILLGAGLVVVEGLMLADVPAGSYMLAALPPKVHGAEGSPCRAVLWSE